MHSVPAAQGGREKENREDGRFCEQLSDVVPTTLESCVSVSGSVHELHILPLEFVGAWLGGWPLFGIRYLLLGGCFGLA